MLCINEKEANERKQNKTLRQQIAVNMCSVLCENTRAVEAKYTNPLSFVLSVVFASLSLQFTFSVGCASFNALEPFSVRMIWPSRNTLNSFFIVFDWHSLICKSRGVAFTALVPLFAKCILLWRWRAKHIHGFAVKINAMHIFGRHTQKLFTCKLRTS